MRHRIRLLVTAGVAVMLAASPAAAPAKTPALPCARTTIAARQTPVGPAQYESGSLTLSNGAALRLQASQPELNVAGRMNVGDAVVACYGPLTAYADAGPARTITVLDLVNGAYYASLVGTWKGSLR